MQAIEKAVRGKVYVTILREVNTRGGRAVGGNALTYVSACFHERFEQGAGAPALADLQRLGVVPR